MVAGALISFVFYILSVKPDLYIRLPYINGIINTVVHTFRPQFYVFFLLGNFIRENARQMNSPMEYVVLFLLGALKLYLFIHPNQLLSGLAFFLFNFFLIRVILKAASGNYIPNSSSLEWLGRNSLGIYLWHVLPIIICKMTITTENLFLFYLASFTFELLFIAAYALIAKHQFIKRFVFGMS